MAIETSGLLGNNVNVLNLVLNTAGILNNKKNVALYVVVNHNGTDEKTNILEGVIGALSGISGLARKIDDTGIVISANIIESSKLAEHPLENGKVLADNKVHLPTEIDVQVTLSATDYKDKLAQIKTYRDENQMIYVETMFGIYPNMQIVGLPCNLTVENINRVTFTIKLREVIVMQEETETESASDMDTINTGTQTGIEKTLSGVLFG